jgi:hypothetical protein
MVEPASDFLLTLEAIVKYDVPFELLVRNLKYDAFAAGQISSLKIDAIPLRASRSTRLYWSRVSPTPTSRITRRPKRYGSP